MLRKMTDLKSYFSQASSGSRLSTRASGVCNEPEYKLEFKRIIVKIPMVKMLMVKSKIRKLDKCNCLDLLELDTTKHFIRYMVFGCKWIVIKMTTK
ncbi:uncharacterized protein LOC100383380 [Zea mays]|uniref:Uncharacterized protein n=1 Tax=Zea mays TaxID=4577 RepID=C0PFH8_MAIZE|nr:uncharacterized protein LOC100383380 [Zea mays]ACN33944.1 unknown [Zea mays]|eukprot:NP_001169506.1 uncharacterized protein LOC100383380 [Zea mays]